MRFLAKSHRTNAIVPPRDGISPVAVAGWAVARVIAEAGKWCKQERVSKNLTNSFVISAIFMAESKINGIGRLFLVRSFAYGD
jgi:hypothetical protein